MYVLFMACSEYIDNIVIKKIEMIYGCNHIILKAQKRLDYDNPADKITVIMHETIYNHDTQVMFAVNNLSYIRHSCATLMTSWSSMTTSSLGSWVYQEPESFTHRRNAPFDDVEC